MRYGLFGFIGELLRSIFYSGRNYPRLNMNNDPFSQNRTNDPFSNNAGYGTNNNGIPRDGDTFKDIPFKTYGGADPFSSAASGNASYNSANSSARPYGQRTAAGNDPRNGFAAQLYERAPVGNIDGYFKHLTQRPSAQVFFVRLAGINENISRFLKRYCAAAAESGAVIEGRIPEPTDLTRSDFVKNVGYGFVREPRFIAQSIGRWLTGISSRQASSLALALYDTLEYLMRQGMSDNALKNCYIMYMCKLKQSFAELCLNLGNDDIPKIIYDGRMTIHDLMLLSTLSRAGCDVLALEYEGDETYLRADPDEEFSELYIDHTMKKFPRGFAISDIRPEPSRNTASSAAAPERPKRKRDTSVVPVAATNTWIKGFELDDLIIPAAKRGRDTRCFYNLFMRVEGVWDKAAYLNELYLARLELINNGITPVIVENGIPLPNNSEISEINVYDFPDKASLLSAMAAQIRFDSDPGLQKLACDSLAQVLDTEDERLGGDLKKLSDMAVYIVCWFMRYKKDLFSAWDYGENGCFMILDGCRTPFESAFCCFLAGLPVDVVSLLPDLSQKCLLEDKRLFVEKNNDSFSIKSYPKEASQMNMGTAAFYAERELDEILYKDTGMYRNKQHEKANTVTLKTMYEEIPILWRNELKYRPNFSTVGDTVNIPVIFAKVSGVSEGNTEAYWQLISELNTDDTVFVTKPPLFEPNSMDGIWSDDPSFIVKGRLMRDRIIRHPSFRYGHLRDSMISHMLDKLQLLLDSRMIKNTFSGGTERVIVSTCLNLDEYIIRKLQSFDFTKTNPKLIYVHTGKQTVSLEDAILAAYMSLLGCDVLFFVPTGYQSVERHFSDDIMEEHQIGPYMYDLRVPDMRRYAPKKTSKTKFRLFKKGK